MSIISNTEPWRDYSMRQRKPEHKQVKGSLVGRATCLQYLYFDIFRLTKTIKCCCWLKTAPQLQYFVHAGDERYTEAVQSFLPQHPLHR